MSTEAAFHLALSPETLYNKNFAYFQAPDRCTGTTLQPCLVRRSRSGKRQGRKTQTWKELRWRNKKERRNDRHCRGLALSSPRNQEGASILPSVLQANRANQTPKDRIAQAAGNVPACTILVTIYSQGPPCAASRFT